MPKVSIIIPTYNAMPYLPATVESIFKQTFTDFELLLVDDGSTDQTVPWITKLTDSRVKLIQQANQGASIARNTGIASVQGDSIAFLDNDDLWQPTKLEQQVQHLDRNPQVGLVHTWMMLIDEKGQSTGRLIKTDAEGWVWKKLVEQDTILNSSVLVRKTCFDQVGVFDPTIPRTGDWEMWLRVAAKYPLGLLKEPLVFYRIHSKNASRNLQAMEQEFQVCIEKIFSTAPSDLLHLKGRSHGFANVYLAWKALQGGDGKQAAQYSQQAFIHYPQLIFLSQYIRLNLAILVLRVLGSEGYYKLLSQLHSIRRMLRGQVAEVRSQN
ncbi:MAG: glycosyltransferase [Leptolyngbyaceae cyanobacterium bins.59]|nr:glycosyltransferase [Leptolyngbyaceae cyanobacterium bins.59]